MSTNKRLIFNLSHRLNNAKVYQAVFRTPDIRLRVGKLLFLAKKNDLTHSRLGIVVAKKHIKKAVDRNYCKRVIRESFRIERCFSSNYDIVVLALSGLQDTFKNELVSDLSKLWGKFKSSVTSY